MKPEDFKFKKLTVLAAETKRKLYNDTNSPCKFVTNCIVNVLKETESLIHSECYQGGKRVRAFHKNS